jgi:hypothetical protein
MPSFPLSSFRGFVFPLLSAFSHLQFAISNLQFSVWVLVGFHLFILAVLALDLGFFQRRPHALTVKEAALWSAVWIGLALLFALGIWRLWPLGASENPELAGEKSVEFLTGYLVELFPSTTFSSSWLSFDFLPSRSHCGIASWYGEFWVRW